MGKPWARIQIGYWDHDKFAALNANAICLWHEGKNYCDKNFTDGLIPLAQVKNFRFFGKKAVEMLTTSCGAKPDGQPYAPLWESHPVGYKMHDYLEHNPCREQILDNIDKAEAKRKADRERLKQWREAKAARARKRQGETRDETPDETAPETFHGVTETQMKRSIQTVDVDTDIDPQKPKEQVSGGGAATPPRPRPLAPIHDASHKKHAVCGRVCLHASLFNDFVRRRNHDNADEEIRQWADGVVDEWTTGTFATIEPGDPFDFWKARYAERWPAAVVSPAKSVPPWLQRVQAAKAAQS